MTSAVCMNEYIGKRVVNKTFGEGVIEGFEKGGYRNAVLVRFDWMKDDDTPKKFVSPDSIGKHLFLVDDVDTGKIHLAATTICENTPLKKQEQILFFDTEVTVEGKRLCDIGAITTEGERFHSTSRAKFVALAENYRFICGHNIIAHDLKYIGSDLENRNMAPEYIDTLLLSPLLFPAVSHHNLIKDDKLQTGDINNPLSDAIKSKDLFFEEVSRFNMLPESLKKIYCSLLYGVDGFRGFFNYLGCTPHTDTENLVRDGLKGDICDNAELMAFININPVELAYVISLIKSEEDPAIIPPWVIRNYPKTYLILNKLRNTPCREGCAFCASHFNTRVKLKEYFGYDSFRLYNGEPLQERAADAAVHGKSLLAIFPTGGGKSLTFQLPALIEGETAHGLTVVISPLQSLMKDQVDGLMEKGIAYAATINSSLDPVERREAIEMVESGVASILYIAPESLRSNSVMRLLRSRNVVRFVIDEAHCFSAWGQDFRVDYQYIGNFIKKYQEDKALDEPIPVSCFTATAKPKVIADIREYFRSTCGLELELFATDTTRKNLRYEVLYREDKEAKIKTVRDLIDAKRCPTIVYVARTKTTEDLASRLSASGIEAVPYHGKMEPREKKRNQDKFMSGEVDVIVATTAFGMGIDKDDVGLIIHYNISASLEDYVQEAGRAGRNPDMKAECFILFNNDDVDKHFQYLTQTKLSQSEIDQVWSGIKRLSKKGRRVCKTPLEIAKAAGWDDNLEGADTKVKTAIAALEQAGYLIRGNNMPRVYADGINAYSNIEASKMLEEADYEDAEKKDFDAAVLSYLFTTRTVQRMHQGKGKYNENNGDVESRVDYIADRMGVPTGLVIESVIRLRDHKILNDAMDMSAVITEDIKQTKAEKILNTAANAEKLLMKEVSDDGIYSIKELNTNSKIYGLKTNPDAIKDVILFWVMHNYIAKTVVDANRKMYISKTDRYITVEEAFHRISIAKFIISYLYKKSESIRESRKEVPFSILEIKEAYNKKLDFFTDSTPASSDDVIHALSFLNRTNAMQLDGGFLVFYNAIQVERIDMDNKNHYNKDDYKQFKEFYLQRIQQVHIVAEFAHMMMKSYDEALEFVNEYFSMDYMLFKRKYFKGDRAKEINRSITAEKYNKLFESLSIKQREIIDDDKSKNIVVAAGPGSGKTMVLVHKLASLLLMEDTKVEQLLMLTFSRSAATEFKQRLIKLIGNAGYYVDVKTFHSFCFDLIGEMGTLTDSNEVVRKALEMIADGEVDTGRLTRTVLVIDEAQDMDSDEFALVEALMDRNASMRVIAVGDDDQNIYEFRNSDSKYMRNLVMEHGAKQYELVENYRSGRNIVKLANKFATTIRNRMKTEPIVSVKDEAGLVMLKKFRTSNMIVPTFELIQDTYEGGSCCVMTNTNDEALLMTAILKQNGYKARLIQSIEEFNLINLYEVRSFVEMLGDPARTPVIPDEIWENAISSLKERFENSTCLAECLELIQRFQSVNRRKYYADLIEYIQESKLEDFTTNSNNTILVSTIHKSKGREFDNVYMMLNNYRAYSDSNKHVIYVGMTRAKNELYICYNTNDFDSYRNGDVHFVYDADEYDDANEATLQVSHKGVNLGYFKYVSRNIRQLCSGDELFAEDGGFYMDPDKKRCVLKLSKRQMEDISTLTGKGFKIYKAEVRNLVYWQGQNDAAESLIVLPNIYFRRQ